MVLTGQSIFCQYQLQAVAMVRLLRGVEVPVLLKFLLNSLTSHFEKLDIRDAIIFHFLAKVEYIAIDHLLCVPLLKLWYFFSQHSFGVVQVWWWYDTLIVLVLQGVKFMREEPFMQVDETEGGRKRSQTERKKLDWVNKFCYPIWQNFDSHVDLFFDFPMVMEEIL